MSTDPQNTKVQRYTPALDLENEDIDGNVATRMDPAAGGSWVFFPAYAALEAQNARLRELVGALKDKINFVRVLPHLTDDVEQVRMQTEAICDEALALTPDNFPTEKK